VIASALGVLLMIFQVRFPPVLQNGLDLIGHSGPPVALVALGGMLGMMPAKTLLGFNRAAAIATVTKILLAPALVAAALYLVISVYPAGADPLIFKVAILLAACPTAVSVFIQTRLYNVWYEGAGITIAQSTLFSLFTFSALALILTHL